ncbi:MAG: hypothetical protein GTN67_03185 [Hydrotalea flava]|uniref:DUF5606 family protein n=1 Tax=Hydrotalea lipotrueae TaxID=2803817 RepID=UPI0016B19F06|nr:DUF5606 domain-containing protein [Hydrotalea lipotrueae]NIM34463.1 hypothetical protein [Hydrotalea flava]NIM37303.1 hypothetical protein [Hydrotalea flava]NIN02482.1 hypothetical protein [Hydrotalea flava]NIN14148.1 hypothetical protein [Hydrotalea flava]NIO93229.1 hypothetical protein [Hydrotalea flava]
MEYRKLIAISGMSGLFELVGSKTDGAIVRSLEDNTTKFVSSRVHNFSHIESIEIFTIRENVNLVEVFKAMDKNAEVIPSEKDPKAILNYFKKVYPEMDFDRVYASDMKKMVRWYGIIKQNDIAIELPEHTDSEETTSAD